jgi:tetratricopeptide (TPR) repeat protein
MHTRRGTIASLLALLLLGTPDPSPGQHATSQPGDQHGTVSFENSCRPEVQPLFQRAVAMLHSFRYVETEKAFREVLARDPSCAIATWGIAAILMSNPLAGVGPSAQWAERAQQAIAEGRRIGAKTARERDYIEAVAAYYDQTYATYLRAAAILEQQFVAHPHHPGVAHYLIHSYDAAPIAARGLTAARRYASIAPAAPHALHMPSHIFTRVGAWAESIATNERSAEAARENRDFDEQLHAMDYLVYAMLQLGRDADARRVVEAAAGATGVVTLRFAGPYAQAAMPARYAVERGDWAQAMTLEARPSQFHFATAFTHFARALGAARSGNVAAAEKDGQELARLRDAMRAKSEYWATEIEVSRLAAAAWTAAAQGKNEEALDLMRRAADMEDRNEKHIVTPGRLLPARELLGEMLLVLKRPADALKEFEASQTREPERFRGYHGAARAAALAGDRAKARQYFDTLVKLAGPSSARPEVAEARAYIAANP